MPEHRGLLSGRRLKKGDTACEKNMVRQVRDEPRAHRWDREWCVGSENDPKTGADEWLRNFIVVRDTRGTLGLGTKRTASWETQKTSDRCTSPTTSPRRPDERQIKQFKRQHIFVIANASSGRNSTTRDCSNSISDSRSQQSKTMGSNVPVVLAGSVLSAATPKLHFRSSTPTKRPAESMTLDVPSQAKHPARRRVADGRSEYDSGWNRDIWNRG